MFLFFVFALGEHKHYTRDYLSVEALRLDDVLVSHLLLEGAVESFLFCNVPFLCIYS